jgi:SsrA-binding protein
MEIATNRKAFRDYAILDKMEAGIALVGTEVKSIRLGLVNLQAAYAKVENTEVFLYDLDIQPYERASHEQHVAKRKRKLLLHTREIDKLFGEISVKGRALIPLQLYWKKGRVKVELGIGKGKASHDKREDLKKKAAQRDTDRELARYKGR